MTNISKFEPVDQNAVTHLLLQRTMMAIMSRLSNEEIKEFERLNNDEKCTSLFTAEAERYLREHISNLSDLIRNEIEESINRSEILLLEALSENQQKIESANPANN